MRWGDATWRLEEHGFPNEKAYLPARNHGIAYGHFILTPTPGTEPNLHARRTAIVLADLTATALANTNTDRPL